jgi:benzodiazapine receptor
LPLEWPHWRSAPVPHWLVLLILMELVILGINPTRGDFVWFQGLRRPAWLRVHVWIPVFWLVIYGCFYLSALVSWEASRNWRLTVAYVLLLVLVESYTWITCRTRRLGVGTVVCLAGWAYGLVFALVLTRISVPAAILIVPYLIWSPVEALITWQMLGLNGFRPGLPPPVLPKPRPPG